MNNVTPNVLAHAAARILIVEDDRDLAILLIDLLRGAGYHAEAVGSGIEMDRVRRTKAFDLIVLDKMLPREDGFSICRRIRSSDTTPILMLTALTQEIDRVVGLELGADDYVTKPFQSRELLARIKALLRRATYSTQFKQTTDAMTFSGWRIDPINRDLTDSEGDHVPLTTAEFDVLLVFCRNPRQVMTRQEILARTHAGSAGPVERSIDVHVSRLRQKIEPDYREPTFIKTVRLGGYIFTPQVEIAQ